MGKFKDDKEWIFWITIVVSFVLIEHNSADPFFLFAFSLLPLLILLFFINVVFIQ